MGSGQYQRTLQAIYSLEKLGSSLGLERVRAILAKLGNPQENYRCVLVGGSNGKGSAVYLISSAIGAAGFSVGTYTSPQIVEFLERIRINGKNCSEKDIIESYAKVIGICKKGKIRATFFEVVTAMALEIFRSHKVDFAVLEVGLGGRLDATNAVEPELSCITSISLEHTEVLGSTVQQIAHEKCGIARPNRPIVFGSTSEEAAEAAKKEAEGIGALPIFVSQEVIPSGITEEDGRFSFSATFRETRYDFSLTTPGRFQISNAQVGCAACHTLNIPKKAIESGISRCVVPFRWQTMSRRPQIVADCAHNPEAAWALAHEAGKLQQRPRVLLFSAMKDKDHRTVLATLAPLFEQVVLTQVSIRRAAPLSSLALSAKSAQASFVAFKTPAKALDTAKKLAGRKGLVVVAGSVYLLAELFGKEKLKVAQ